jgi:hypothetical protein
MVVQEELELTLGELADGHDDTFVTLGPESSPGSRAPT